MTSTRIYTVTMAELYARQGYLRKAAGIYKHLIDKEPGREDLRKTLAEIEQKIEKQSGPTRKELGLLVREWADLINQLKELKRK
ncbi:MAG: hypothetical protein PVJ19_08730 [Desulfobacteraceae bacterium]|jgi:hypothetical protein